MNTLQRAVKSRPRLTTADIQRQREQQVLWPTRREGANSRQRSDVMRADAVSPSGADTDLIDQQFLARKEVYFSFFLWSRAAAAF